MDKVRLNNFILWCKNWYPQNSNHYFDYMQEWGLK